MKNHQSHRFGKLPLPHILTLLFMLSFASLSHAEIYKWVDENGQVHFSDKKQQGNQTKVEEIKIKPLPNIISDHAVMPPIRNKQEDKPSTNNKAKRFQPPQQKWGGAGPETDAKRCALAKDILSGLARHVNGTPIDDYDIKVAKRDVEKYCR